ncbi:LADA_0H03554g1_1 [Lachancea dasiensis]|uniref:ubiquitinyl hydrolase 1 n=1 Tax=Lachancea dasiensis TaxID=1072105 RepID=A0A1G4K0G7_9SACH|nr:LADA_0H03554g1_1 [Lachancea dasiensis]
MAEDNLIGTEDGISNTKGTELKEHGEGKYGLENECEDNSNTKSYPTVASNGQSGGLLALTDQRDILSKLYEESRLNSKEGDAVYVIPSTWFDNLWNPEVLNSYELGPIDTVSICHNFDAFVLADYQSKPYVSVPEPVFKKLLEWYGLTPGSRAIKTVLIRDDDGQLVTEYDQYCIRVHLLKATKEDQTLRHSSSKRKPLYFSASRLTDVKAIVKRCIQDIGDMDSTVDLSQQKFRIWRIETEQDEAAAFLLSQRYAITPFDFAQFLSKDRLRPDIFDTTIRTFKKPTVDLVVETKESQSDDHWPSNYFYYNKLTLPRGTVGLSNLGNTCYMNSALQCLVHIPELSDYFLYGSFEGEINSSNPLGYKGQVAKAFAALVRALFNDKVPNLAFYSPRIFKSTLGHHNSMFGGYLQQDSQEFLAFLLDGLHEDLNRIVDKPIVEKPELTAGDNIHDPQVIQNLANDTWEKHMLRNDSLINDLFVGMYKSTLTCPVCDHISVTFDPFSDLTLPLPVESYWSSNVKIFPQNSPPCLLQVELSKGSTYEDLKRYVSKAANLRFEDLIGAEIFNHAFYNNYESPTSDAKYLPINDLASENDIIVFYELPNQEDCVIIPVLNTIVEEGFRSQKLFGYPFFISLDKNERQCYGAIRKQLERHYANLSGNFASFPSPSTSPTMETMDLLRKKYPNVDLSNFSEDLKYSTPVSPERQKFAVQVLTRDNAEVGSQANREEGGIWTPDPRGNLATAVDMTTLITNVARDIYNYQELVDNQMDEIEEYAMWTNIPELNAQHGTDNADHQSSITPGHANDNDTNIPSDAALITNNQSALPSTPSHFPRPILIGPGQAIVCRWNNEAISTVFSKDSEFSWDNPAEIKNSELDEMRIQRNERAKKQITIEDCLNLFSKSEILGASDSWYCPSCKEHRQAAKQIQLWNTPEILTIHLKRFENRDSFSDKITEVVSFPISGLDMSGHLVCGSEKQSNVYDLIAVDNHYGGLGGGHYTAFAKNFADGKWYYFDDSRVFETKPERSISEAAYLLFYRRREAGSSVNTARLQLLLESSRQAHQLKMDHFNQQQEHFYGESRSDSEDDLQVLEWDQPDAGENDVIDNVSSLEVGNSPLGSSPEENDGRRKLRLLHKNYATAMSNSHNLNSSTTSPDSSDVGDNVSQPCSSVGCAPPSPTL